MPDSNVYVSAIVFGGKPMMLLDMAEEGEIELFTSEPILRETYRVLREKFDRTADQLEADRLNIATLAKSVTPTETLNVVSLDPDDDRVLECASPPARPTSSRATSTCSGLAASGASGSRT